MTFLVMIALYCHIMNNKNDIFVMPGLQSVKLFTRFMLARELHT